MNATGHSKLTPQTKIAYEALDAGSRVLGDMKHLFSDLFYDSSVQTEKQKLETAMNWTFSAENILKGMRDEISKALAALRNEEKNHG